MDESLQWLSEKIPMKALFTLYFLTVVLNASAQIKIAGRITDERGQVVSGASVFLENTYDGETKKQIVLTFAGKDKVLGLNFTNASRIEELIGTENYRDWDTQKI